MTAPRSLGSLEQLLRDPERRRAIADAAHAELSSYTIDSIVERYVELYEGLLAQRGAGGMSDTLVLCYHAVSESWTADLSITPARFERQLELLVERGYRGATLSEAVTTSPAQRTVAITFDDGYRSVLDLAFPIMSRLGLVGSVYVVTDFVGSPAPMSWPGVDQWLGGPHEQEMLPMDADQLHRLMDAGWEVGSHTRTHPKLTESRRRAAGHGAGAVARAVRAAAGPALPLARLSVR